MERAFGTIQSERIQEIAFLGINTIEEYNAYMDAKNEEQNQKYLSENPIKENVFTQYTVEQIKARFIQQFTRVVTSGLTVTINGVHYEVLGSDGKTRMRFRKKLTIYESYLNQGVY